MRAFLQGIVAMLVITLVAATTLKMLPMSSSDVFQDKPHVRL
jgi:hypothetical protein